jgi:release factor glutamine methyltransferase
MHGDDVADATTAYAVRLATVKRRAGAPLAYAVGRAAFRHLTLAVDERVLIPRPETEVLVDLVLEGLAEGDPGVVVDVGTGSGAIALALASEGAGRVAGVIGSDVSSDALAVAAANARAVQGALRVPVSWRQGSYLAPVSGERGLSAVVSNPPYISYGEADALPSAVRSWEPSVALLAGDDGMAAIGAVVREAAGVLRADGLLAIEVDARRAGRAAEIVETDGRYHAVRVRLDLTGRERFVLARRSAHGVER